MTMMVRKDENRNIQFVQPQDSGIINLLVYSLLFKESFLSRREKHIWLMRKRLKLAPVMWKKHVLFRCDLSDGNYSKDWN